MRRLFFVFLSIAGCVVIGAPAAHAFPGGPWSPPVDGPVVRGFDPPATRFGPGHLGVDYGVAPGAAVRAAGAGTVVFAGRVGSGLHVVVLHAGGVRTTDSFLATITVVRGQHVAGGAIVGTSGGTGSGHSADVLHFGVRLGDEYVDPMLLFAPPDLGAVVHLAEPHGGSLGGPAEPRPDASGGEAAQLAAALRVDARPPLRPPSWWVDAARAASRAPAPEPPTTTTTAARSSPARDPAGPAPAAGAVGGGVAVGAVTALRRRSRRRAYG